MGMAPVKGIEADRIGVDRDGQNVVAFVEDALRAVAVVNVHVEDRGPVPELAQVFGCDAGVVQETEAAGQIAESMMAGRAAQHIDRLFAAMDEIRAREGALRRPVGGLPGAGRDRAGGIGLVKAGLSDGGAGVACRAPVGMDIGDDFVGCAVDPAPAGVDRLQEDEVFGGVKGGDRAEAMIVRRLEGTAGLPRTVLQDLDTARLFRVRIKRAVGHEMLGIVDPLPLVENGFHGVPFSSSSAEPASDR